MKVEVYVYETLSLCDIVFFNKDFGVIAIEEYGRDGSYGDDNDFLESKYENLSDYAETINKPVKRTYLGTL